MKRSTVIALTLIVCGVLTAGTGAVAQQAADPSGTADGATDSTLEIAPNYPQPSPTPPPGSSDAGAADTQTGTAQDYLTNQGSGAAPMPQVAGIDDYMNQEAAYEAVSTGLPPIALLPPPAYYPYYYPGFYSRFYGSPPPVITSPRSQPPPIYRAPPPPPPVLRPPPPPPPRPPSYHPFFGPHPGHGGFHNR